jgi:threonine-phosphate decarboxylase
MLRGHGDDSYRFGKEIVADFSTNVWYGAEPSGLKEYLIERWSAINRYPEVIAESLSEKIAIHYGLNQDNVLVNNGSTESIYIIAQAFEAKSSTILIPSFSEYEDACKLYKHQISYKHWDELEPGLKIETDLCFICNPNNPTGSVFLELEALIRSNPKTIFIVDEAFIDFTESVSSMIGKVVDYHNLVVLHSLTKTYAIPGLRLGFIAAADRLIDQFKSFKFPWSVNAMALNAGHFIFDNFEKVQLPLRTLLEDKREFTAALRNEGFEIHDSHTHFFLLRLNQGTAAELKSFLIENHGILVRDASNFRGLDNKYIRLATLQPEKNQLLLQTLTEWEMR